jgi:uncharacterized repeat protein (TIGR01451 family)
MSRRFIQSVISMSLSILAMSCVSLFLSAAASRSAHARSAPIGLSAGPMGLQSTAAFTIALQFVDDGFDDPVQVTNAHDDINRLFVVEQAGHIRVIKNGSLLASDFLDIHSIVESGGEQGLLSVAFDPNYKTNGTFYVNYTTAQGAHPGDTVIARYVISNPLSDVGQVVSVTNLITIYQPESNHNGGQLQFGPNDNYLYIGTGDGGGGGDNHGVIGNGQNLNTLLGKILRLNVRGVPTYTIPASNPFTQTANTKKEIWAYGLRNPWRFSFDRSNGDLYIGDVGQGCWEEINYQASSSHGGENYGWRLMEGFYYFDHDTFDCGQPIVAPGALITLTRPITNYDHSLGSAVSGGYVYRGSQYAWLNGVYFYADFGSGRIWTVQQTSPGNWASGLILGTGHNISSFGEDQNGEVYVVSYYAGIYKIISSAPSDYSSSLKTASNSAPHQGDVITYAIVLRNSGNLIANTVRVTDVIPIGLSYVNGSFTATRGTPDQSSAPTLKWSGVMSNVAIVTLTYAVTVSINTTQALINTATINPGIGSPFTRSATVVVNGWRVYLPLLLKNH